MALIAQLGEHCAGIAEVVGSNPAQSLKMFSRLCSSSVTAALALMTVITQLLLWDKLLSSNLSRVRSTDWKSALNAGVWLSPPQRLPVGNF